ncbi:hypothetical protein WJX73_008417 [Symbiochloris irregularis]|uniref:Deoxyribodipyrimidine photo-lyase n=1 Tax=Symbiochloris irregularis TaxID=706552 RepID=A0AAW1PFQ0_9CHLO
MAPKKAAGTKRKAKPESESEPEASEASEAQEEADAQDEEASSEDDGDKASTGGVDPSRVRALNDGSLKEGPILYWMSRDQRVNHNWALLHACALAEKHKAPVGIVFNLVPEYLGAGARQFGFMLRGLQSLQSQLSELQIAFHLTRGNPEQTIPKLAQDVKAGALVVDQSPVRIAKKWREDVAKKLGGIPLYEVDAHNVVPVWVASDKREYGARTIRSKIHKQLPKYLKDFPDVSKQAKWKDYPKADWDKVIKEVVDRGKEVPEIDWAKPGQAAAWKALEAFVSSKERIGIFDAKRNDPNQPKALSGLSPYIHFGQLSMQAAALEAIKHKSKFRSGVDAFLEEAVVRRELSDNFCFYEADYDSLSCISDWARNSLEAHKGDKREYTYTWDQFERGETHDELWNAAQHQMVYEGKMHGFLRMYWAKKILEWTQSPEEALDFAIRLNDKWEIDGRDPNGYVGCMWSVGGIHDQGWSERAVFGKIRYMNYNGCKRKMNIEAYVASVNKMVKEAKKKQKFPF